MDKKNRFSYPVHEEANQIQWDWRKMIENLTQAFHASNKPGVVKTDLFAKLARIAEALKKKGV